MRINNNKAVWDPVLKKPVPVSHQTIFFEEKVTGKRLDDALQHNVTYQLQESEVLNMTIKSQTYKKSRDYTGHITFFYKTSGEKPHQINEPLQDTTPKDKPYKKFAYFWACSCSKVSKPVVIPIDIVCDGEYHCSNCTSGDHSDEALGMCQPKDTLFQDINTAIVVSILIIGTIVFFIVRYTIKKARKTPEILITEIAQYNAETLIDVCESSNENNYDVNDGLSRENVNKIDFVYTPCQQDSNGKQFFGLLFTLSLVTSFKDFSHQIFDRICLLEVMRHRNSVIAKECLNFFYEEDCYLSDYVKYISERYDFFSKVKQFLLKILNGPCLALGYFLDEKKFQCVNLWIQIILCCLMGLKDLLFFHYDLLKDLIVLSVLSQVENKVLDGAGPSKFDSVGGVNFKVIRYYLVFIFVASEVLRFYFVHQRQEKFLHTLNIPYENKIVAFCVKVIPLHFATLTRCILNIKILMLIDELETLFRKDNKNVSTLEERARNLIMISHKLDYLSKELYHVNALETQIQLLETVLERDPQCVVQMALFLLMLRFPRIKILFDSYFGIEIQNIFMVTLAITIYSIVKSLMNFLHARRFPVEPGFSGKILQFLSLTIIITSKVLLISMALLNAVYLHLFLHIVSINVAYLLYIRIYGSEAKLFNYMVIISLLPTFYSPPSAANAARNRNSEENNKRFKIIEKITSPILLHMVVFGVYSVVALILRETTFFYNIKLASVTDKDDYYRKFVVNFPIWDIMGFYAAAVAMHLATSALYYRFGHPWKVLLWGDRTLSSAADDGVNTEENVELHEIVSDSDETETMNRNTFYMKILLQSSGCQPKVSPEFLQITSIENI